MNFILKSIKNPHKTVQYIKVGIKKRLLTKKDVLIIVGADPKGELTVLHPGYKTCYIFEAHPNRYRKLEKKYNSHKNIKIYNFAVAEYDGVIEFNISSNNDGASSSIGSFSGKWQGRAAVTEISMIDKIKVPCINLFNF